MPPTPRRDLVHVPPWKKGAVWRVNRESDGELRRWWSELLKLAPTPRLHPLTPRTRLDASGRRPDPLLLLQVAPITWPTGEQGRGVQAAHVWWEEAGSPDWAFDDLATFASLHEAVGKLEGAVSGLLRLLDYRNQVGNWDESGPWMKCPLSAGSFDKPAKAGRRCCGKAKASGICLGCYMPA